jgi:hypothetical protein
MLRYSYKIFGNLGGGGALGRQMHRWRDRKIGYGADWRYLKEIGCEDVKWLELTLNWVQ